MAALNTTSSGHAPSGGLRDRLIGPVEAVSVQPIPASQRTGRVRSQLFLWFSTNANGFQIILGTFVIGLGLNLFWGVTSIVLGTVLGSVIVALHGPQGPRTGVSQLLQSRGQFGYNGAFFLLALGIILDVGYLAGGEVAGGDALNSLASGIPVPVWVVIFAVPALLLAVYGYRLIHAVQPYLAIIMIGTFIALTVLLALSGDPLAKGMGGTHLPSLPAFIVCTGIFFVNEVSWAIYTSDYARKLPRDVSGPKVFWAVYVGNCTATIMFCCLGAWVAAISPSATSATSALARIVGTWVLPILAVSLITGAAMNAYTGMLSIESIRATWHDMTPSRAWRLAGVGGCVVAATIFAVLGYRSLVTDFSNFLELLLFFFIPWTVINLVNFYWVERGQYDLDGFLDRNGVYRGWRGVAIVPYLIGLAAQIPFIDQSPVHVVGPMVHVLGGSDISWIVGGIVTFAAYVIAVRRAGAGAHAARPPETAVPIGDPALEGGLPSA